MSLLFSCVYLQCCNSSPIFHHLYTVGPRYEQGLSSEPPPPFPKTWKKEEVANAILPSVVSILTSPLVASSDKYFQAADKRVRG